MIDQDDADIVIRRIIELRQLQCELRGIEYGKEDDSTRSEILADSMRGYRRQYERVTNNHHPRGKVSSQ